MELREKLLNIQSELKAPKNQTNKFGGYNYRSCEDILEAVKPLLLKHKATLTIEDGYEISSIVINQVRNSVSSSPSPILYFQ